MRNPKYLHGTIIAAIGVFAGAIPVFDMAEDVFVGGKTPLSTLIENFPLLVLGVSIVGAAGWLVQSDFQPSHTRTVTKLAIANVVGVAILIGLVVMIQLRLQDDLKPFIIAADAIVIGALGGVALGIRSAQHERATDEAAAQRDRFQALFDNVPNPIVGVEFVDDSPIVRAVNPAFTEVFGFDRHTILGQNLVEYIVPEDETFDPADQAMTSEDLDLDAWDKDVIDLETVDGRREFVRLTAPVERGPARDKYAIYIDVTVERQRRERLRVLSRTLRHDIRNHLTVIDPLSHELAADLEGESGEKAARIASAAEDLLEVSERTNSLEKQIAGESDPVRRELTEPIERVVTDMREQYDCDLTLQLPDRAFGMTTAGFEAAVEALVENGIEHNDQSPPRVDVSIVEGFEEGYQMVKVADNGPGIPPDQIDLVNREIGHTQTKHALGLGLWTARWVMRNCGGDVTFEPNTPRGTVVTLKIPLAEEPADATNAAQ